MSTSIVYDPTSHELKHVSDQFGVDQDKAVSLEKLFARLGDLGYFDSGLMPTDDEGIIWIRKAGGFTQVTYQIPPGAHYVHWGEYEGSTGDKMLLAMPYRIIVMDWHDLEQQSYFIGARHFYSPTPIRDLDQQLYHVNVPNTNCRGYNNTSVGWTCLYGHGFPAQVKTFHQKVHHIVVRMSGDEPYNDANMSGTDGPNTYRIFYSQAKPKTYTKYDYMWDRYKWAAKTKKDGYEWISDPKLLLPILVGGIDDQKAHKEKGEKFTFRYATMGNYQAYYTDPWRPRPFNVLDREDLQASLEKDNTLKASMAYLFSPNNI